MLIIMFYTIYLIAKCRKLSSCADLKLMPIGFDNEINIHLRYLNHQLTFPITQNAQKHTVSINTTTYLRPPAPPTPTSFPTYPDTPNYHTLYYLHSPNNIPYPVYTLYIFTFSLLWQPILYSLQILRCQIFYL